MAVPALKVLAPEQCPLPFRSGSGRPSREMRERLARAAQARQRAITLFGLASEIAALEQQTTRLVERGKLTLADVDTIRKNLAEVRRLTRLYVQATVTDTEED